MRARGTALHFVADIDQGARMQASEAIGGPAERKAGQRLRSQVLKELICFCNVLQLKITLEGADRAASF